MKWLKQLWSAATSKSVAFILAAAGFSVAIYSVWFYRAQPAVAFEVVSDTKVLDIHESIGALDVTYGGQSLKTSNKELRVLQLIVANTGRADITKDAFDLADPFGFQVPGGQILEPPLVSGSSDYLTHHASVKEPNSNTVLIAPIILESGEWMHLKLLVAMNAGDFATIQPIGKVAGVKSAAVVDLVREIANQSLWSRVLHSDDWTIRILLAPVWFITFLLVLVLSLLLLVGFGGAIVVPFGRIRDIPVKRHRLHMIETYKKTQAVGPADHFVVDEYYKRGRAAIPALYAYVATTEKNNAEAREISSMRAHVLERFSKEIVERNVRFREAGQSDFSEALGIHSRGIPGDVDVEFRRSVGSRPRFPEAIIRGIETHSEGLIAISPVLLPAIKRFGDFLLVNGEGPLDEASTANERRLGQ
jgi:hypothetical protein